MRPSLLAAILLAAFTSFAVAENWPQWRGPLGTGISQETKAPTIWSKDKNIKWQIQLPGPGNSTPIVWEDKVFVTCADKSGKQRGTYCFDRNSGKELWQKVVQHDSEEQTHEGNPPCSASPVTDGERVVAWHGSAGLFCYDLNGKELWRKDLGKFEHIWGTASSPVIYKNLVIQHAGPGLSAFVVAYDKNSGAEVWRKEYEGTKSEKVDEYRGSWSTPVIYNAGRRDVMLLSLPEKLRAVDPISGEEIWSAGGATKLFYTSPLISKEAIVVMCGYGGPAYAVRGGGEGDVTESRRLWLHEKNSQRVGSGVIVDEKVYILNDDGVAWCIDVPTGEVHWKQRLGGGPTWPSAVAVGKTVYFSNSKGTVYVVEANPEECKVLEQNNTDGQTMHASPAISGGEIFLRTHASLFCIAEAAK
jgi:outer membrane protein assembly factor BamB